MNSKRSQSGYMLEIPLIMLAVGVLLAIALPRLPVMFGKGLLMAGVLVWIGGLYYMIVVPGWRPGSPSRMRRVWRWTLFLALAALLSFVAGAYIMAIQPGH